jgi:hypothetical protein
MRLLLKGESSSATAAPSQVIDPGQLVALQREVDRVEHGSFARDVPAGGPPGDAHLAHPLARRVAARRHEPGRAPPVARRAQRPHVLHRRRHPRSRRARCSRTASASRRTPRATCRAAKSARRRCVISSRASRSRSDVTPGRRGASMKTEGRSGNDDDTAGDAETGAPAPPPSLAGISLFDEAAEPKPRRGKPAPPREPRDAKAERSEPAPKLAPEEPALPEPKRTRAASSSRARESTTSASRSASGSRRSTRATTCSTCCSACSSRSSSSRRHERAVAARSRSRGATAAGAGRPRAPRRDRGLQPQEARPLLRDRGGGSARRTARRQALLLPQDQPLVRAGRRVPAHAGAPRARPPHRLPHRDALPLRPLREVARGHGRGRSHHLPRGRPGAPADRARRRNDGGAARRPREAAATRSTPSARCARATIRATSTGARARACASSWSSASAPARRAPTSSSSSTWSAPKAPPTEFAQRLRAPRARGRVARRRPHQARRRRRRAHQPRGSARPRRSQRRRRPHPPLPRAVSTPAGVDEAARALAQGRRQRAKRRGGATGAPTQPRKQTASGARASPLRRPGSA